MSLKVYNTLINEKEEFIPLDDKKVKMYVCGPTVYDKCHIGHARCYVAFDLIRRYLEFSGYRVTYVQNFTDVDDKIINKSLETGEDPFQIAERYIDDYFTSMDSLNVKRADIYCKATDHIEDMISFVENLVEKGIAYAVEGNVYFSVEKAHGYGQLSGIDIEQMKAGARIAVDEKKHDPLDFALWKRAKEGEPRWKSPWGDGRPGWHIECSTMSRVYLGDTLDIHGGGQDLIFPHHENEIAQSQAATGNQFVRYWLHNGFVTIHDEKMSKSLGNIVTVEDLLKKYSPETLRYFLISSQYRKPIDFTEANLEEAEKAITRLFHTIDNIRSALEKQSREKGEAFSPEPYLQQFKAAMDDDFNTPLALAVLFELARETNRRIEQGTIDTSSLKGVYEIFIKLGDVLGLLFHREMEGLTEDILHILINVRNTARERKLWDISDTIREQLRNIGIYLEDSSQGTKWKIGKKQGE